MASQNDRNTSLRDEMKEHFGAEDRQFIDREGTYYLKLTEYDYFDGTFDKKTGRGYKGSMGPAFTFAVVEGPLPAGTVVSRMIKINGIGSTPDKTKATRRARISEIKKILFALIVSKEGEGAADDLDADQVADTLEKVDLVNGELTGVVVRCDAQRGQDPKYINCKWSPDDREGL